MEWTEASQCMLKPREFVPWGLPGPTRGRRDAAALASKTKGTARIMGGRVGVGPTDYTPSLPMQPSGRPWASKRAPGKHLIPNILAFFIMMYYGEVNKCHDDHRINKVITRDLKIGTSS